jgi:hypothetical protein
MQDTGLYVRQADQHTDSESNGQSIDLVQQLKVQKCKDSGKAK